jgi:non-heme chloroperoxidase
MPTITTTDGIEIFCKDWGSGQPIVFSHGWPLSSDDWDNQTLFFLQHGYRVIVHSTGAGEVVRSIARHAESRVARAVPISAVPPLIVQARVAA